MVLLITSSFQPTSTLLVLLNLNMKLLSTLNYTGFTCSELTRTHTDSAKVCTMKFRLSFMPPSVPQMLEIKFSFVQTGVNMLQCLFCFDTVSQAGLWLAGPVRRQLIGGKMSWMVMCGTWSTPPPRCLRLVPVSNSATFNVFNVPFSISHACFHCLLVFCFYHLNHFLHAVFNKCYTNNLEISEYLEHGLLPGGPRKAFLFGSTSSH